jgi:hypothetical protein
MDLLPVPTSEIRYSVAFADEMYIHQAATDKILQGSGIMGTQPRYNLALNTHEQVSELAESITAELIVARYFGLDYDARQNNGKHHADVGQGLEIKWTKYESGHLIIYPNDRDNDVAIMVVGKSPTYRIAGWIPVQFAKRAKYKHRSQDSWWIEQHNLFPIEDLVRSEHGRSLI